MPRLAISSALRNMLRPDHQAAGAAPRQPNRGALRGPTDLHGVRELELLRGDVDVVAPRGVAGDALIRVFADASGVGDHLRLPQRTRHSGPSMRRAVARVLAAGSGADPRVTAPPEAEATMLAVLNKIDELVAGIEHRTRLRGEG